MKAIMVMFDTLNRRMLPPYGCTDVHAPNFERLASRTVAFDNSYAGSLPCMPARRELHTGRYNMLHRSWGPLEPYDDSMPEILKKSGIYTHLVTDHQHYWEDGGATYHHRYNSFEFFRGQEGDFWKGEVRDPEIPEHHGNFLRQDAINRKYMDTEDKQPQPRVFQSALEFLETNKDADNFFLQIETFDPHEPYYTMQHYKDLYSHEYKDRHFDWPPYFKVTEPPKAVEHCRYEYKALLSMCDHYLGRVLNFMNEHDMWKDTMLIVNTDHGFLLGEHDFWAKCIQPFYNEVAHTPLFVWDPRIGIKGEHRHSLVQTIDIAPTLLEFFGVDIPETMQGKPLKQVVEKDEPIREALLFGMHGGQLNVTDGRYVYMRGFKESGNRPLYNYTHMPTHMHNMFTVEEMRTMKIAPPFSFTKGCPLMKIESKGFLGFYNKLLEHTALYDLENDPNQLAPIDNPEVEKRMTNLMVRLMEENDAPAEQFERLSLI